MIEARVMEDEFAASLARGADFNRRAQALREFFFEAGEIAVGALAPTVRRCAKQALHQRLGFAYRKPARRDARGELDLARAVEREERSRMAHFERAAHQHLLRRLCEFQQAQQVAGRAARAADGVSRLLVRHLEFVDEAIGGRGLLHSVEIFALDVLDERHDERRLVGHLAHDRGNLLESCHLRGAPAPLAGDELIAAIDWAYHYGLQQPLRANRLRQLGKRALIHARSRLVAARADARDADSGERLAWRRVRAKECIEPAAESLRLHAAAPRISLASAR